MRRNKESIWRENARSARQLRRRRHHQLVTGGPRCGASVRLLPGQLKQAEQLGAVGILAVVEQGAVVDGEIADPGSSALSVTPASRRVRGSFTACHRVSRSACNASMAAWPVRRRGCGKALGPHQRQQQAGQLGIDALGCSRARWAGRGSCTGRGAGGSGLPGCGRGRAPVPPWSWRRPCPPGWNLPPAAAAAACPAGCSVPGAGRWRSSTAIRARASLTGFWRCR